MSYIAREEVGTPMKVKANSADNSAVTQDTISMGVLYLHTGTESVPYLPQGW